jgi:thiol-disulfide isomerase/thioredoxin
MSLNRRIFLCTPLLFGNFPAVAQRSSVVVGSHDVDQMKSMKGLTFPRVLLYNSEGALIDRKLWPSGFQGVKDHAGQAFCCVSDKPSPPGSLGPPPDCKVVTYGENVREHFTGLLDSAGREIKYERLPEHRYFVVEYFADWCAPCHPARRALQEFMSSHAAKGYLALVVDFSKLQS